MSLTVGYIIIGFLERLLSLVERFLYPGSSRGCGIKSLLRLLVLNICGSLVPEIISSLLGNVARYLFGRRMQLGDHQEPDIEGLLDLFRIAHASPGKIAKLVKKDFQGILHTRQVDSLKRRNDVCDLDLLVSTLQGQRIKIEARPYSAALQK